MTDDPAAGRTAGDAAVLLAQMSGLLLSDHTVRTALDLVVELAQKTSVATVGAGVSLLGAGLRVTTAASDPVVEQADRLQYELDEGPCLTAWLQRQGVRIDDIASDTRWPRWSAAVAPLGLRSSLSTPLVAGGEALGAMKIYSRSVAGYGEHDELVLGLFAQQAAVLLANVSSYESTRALADQLKEALATRDVIGQAKGIIMAEQHVDDGAAFTVLVRLSQEGHEKLRDVARRLVDATIAGRRP